MRATAYWLMALVVPLLSSECAAAVVTNSSDIALRTAIATGGTVTFRYDGQIFLTNTIEITNNVNIDGFGRSVQISGFGLDKGLITTRPGIEITIANLSFVDGVNRGGGAISNAAARLSLWNVSFANNRAVSKYDATSDSLGGAIHHSAGILAMTNCVFLNNVAGSTNSYTHGGGGAIFNTATTYVHGCIFLGNTAEASRSWSGSPSARGGAIFNAGTLYANDCKFGNNTAAGGSSYVSGVSADNGAAFGGALFSTGSAFIVGCEFSYNVAVGGRGKDGLDGIGTIFDRGGDGAAGDPGGSAYGGAIYAEGAIRMTESLLNNNSAIGGAAGSGGDGGQGAGSGNGGAGGAGGNACGGGVSFAAAAAYVTNCTFTELMCAGGSAGAGGSSPTPNPFSGSMGGSGGNGGAGGSAWGGAIAITNSTVDLAFVTIASNTLTAGTAGISGSGSCGRHFVNPCGTNGIAGQAATASGTGLMNFGNSTVRLVGNIASGPTGPLLIVGGTSDQGYNICSDNSAQFTHGTSRNNTDARVLPLKDNGGLTKTMTPMIGSPAIDVAPAAIAPVMDQRGRSRPAGLLADSGAVEGDAPLRLRIERTNDSVRLSFSGIASQQYRLQRSQTFSNWTTVLTTLATNTGFIDFEDAVDKALYFYRVATP